MRRFNSTKRTRTHRLGSALILAVVLSTLLAVIAVLFLILANVDKIASSAKSDNLEIDYAIDAVLAEISHQLVRDVTGINSSEQEEYYDYPDANNIWLASLQPVVNNENYYWPQISDITGFLNQNNYETQDVSVDPPGTRKVLEDYPDIKLVDGVLSDQLVDADGDGIADSKLFELDNFNTTKGRKIYAAVRIIDNAAMINANTAFRFMPDPNAQQSDIDGSSLSQINLLALANRNGDSPTPDDEDALFQARTNNSFGFTGGVLQMYEQNYIWQYEEPDFRYTPFDISDELELRYRYCINSKANTRLEMLFYNTLGSLEDFMTIPYDGYRNQSGDPKTWRRLDDWCERITNDTGAVYPDMRHLVTTYSMDRIILPDGSDLNNGRMINVNTADKDLLFDAIKAGLRIGNDPNNFIRDKLAAQLTVNMLDLRDDDYDITTMTFDANETIYGFEAQPFINEIAFYISDTQAGNPTSNYFAIELYNPFDKPIGLSDYRLELRDANNLTITISNWSGSVIGANDYFVITNSTEASSEFGITDLVAIKGLEVPNLTLVTYMVASPDPLTYALDKRYDIYLKRTNPTGGEDIYIDRQLTEDDWFDWDQVKDDSQFYGRGGNGSWIVLYQNFWKANSHTLGTNNSTSMSLVGPETNYNIQNSIASFITIGDIARTLTIAPSPKPNDMLGVRLAAEPPESQMRIDLMDPKYAGLFQYLTVIDPNDHGHPESETRIKGRININTTPPFVLSQLPWMDQEYEPTDKYIGQAVTDYRNSFGAFQSIADIMHVQEMSYYVDNPLGIGRPGDLRGWPDLTGPDGAIDDFEERDVIFSRISNLITVRSDVFTAYILVRLGVDGPQRRVIAIFDRSKVNSPEDKVEILAVHPVADPR